MQDSASFWTDIKGLEEQLAKDPDSFCFARLSETYLKVGLIDDAIHVARQGVRKYPAYLSGQKALSSACYAKGLNDEALAALKLVTAAVPEDIESQKLLGRLLFGAGNADAARHAFRTALQFAPDDVECRLELESLDRSAEFAASTFADDVDDDDEIIEDLEILEEIEVFDEDQHDAESSFDENPAESEIPASQQHDPLSTATLAELYIKQGFTHKALEIYRAILADNPTDLAMAARVAELEMPELATPASKAESEDSFEEKALAEPFSGAPFELDFKEPDVAVLSEREDSSVFEEPQISEEITVFEGGASSLSPQGGMEKALATLDGWLENIGRIKSCR